LRREIPLILTAVVGLTFFIQFFVPHQPMGDLANTFSDWYSIISAFAIWLGALNLMKISIEKVSRKQKDWFYAVATIVSFLIITIVGFFFSGGRQLLDLGTRFDWLYRNVYSPLNATMFALLAFFVASASYRAFRARNAQATVLLLAAFIVMMGRTPFGDWITGFLPVGWQMSNLTNVIMNYLNVAGQRAIMIGISLGIVSTSLRIILGIERSYLGGE
jgi:succinate dehydrogenase hydrophobic anchor subunit